MSAGPRIEVVCFDLGGVLVNLAGAEVHAASAGLDLAGFWRRWLESPWVREYESGRCDAVAFANGLVRWWPALAPAEAFLRSFARWPTGLFPGVPETLRALRGRVRTAVLSNTNAIHWEQENRAWDLEGLVDVPFLSYRTGRLKPDADAYEHVCETMGVAPAAVLFLDDNPPNVEAARAVGMAAEHVVGFGAARRALSARGLLEPPSAPGFPPDAGRPRP
jgi:putative hydrolase of the HAD superfamily